MKQASVSTGQPASARQPRRQVSHSVSVVSVKVSTSHEDGSRRPTTNLRQEHQDFVASHEDSRDRYGKNILQQTTAITEKTVRLFLSSKAVVSSKPVNKPSSISSKTVIFSDNLSSIVVVSAIVVSAIAVVCCTHKKLDSFLGGANHLVPSGAEKVREARRSGEILKNIKSLIC